MLIDFKDIITKYNLKINGIIHAGAHYGQEYDAYVINGVNKVIFIEPCKEAFNVILNRFRSNNDVSLFNCALGAKDFTTEMNVESANKGMSNSILIPKKHLAQYPDIKFENKEQVKVHRLDNLVFSRGDYNFLCMDIQGYELEALKGATHTLASIDYIYTEVNRDELYEKCARVEQLDKYLKGFDRVHTNWAGGTWGDAVYVRRNINKKIINVPAEFKPRIRVDYPPDNKLIFEEWFYKSIFESELKSRHYLPVFWTSYYVNNNYGKDPSAINKLQDFLNALDKTKKYFTICQYDDGILNDLSGLNIKAFHMAKDDNAIPLLCQPHSFSYTSQKDIFANFIGSATHPIRSFVFNIKEIGYYISNKKYKLEDYCKILSRSVFTLCPRGYGKTSFRIAEALQYGSIPVYVSDEFVIPHKQLIDFKKYGVLIKEKDAGRIDSILRAISQKEIKKKQASIKKVYEKYFTYESNEKIILDNV